LATGRELRLFFVAGEASGDLHASNVIRAIRSYLPNARISGLGGPLMAGAGCTLLFDLRHELGEAMWFRGLLASLRRVYRIQRATLDYFDDPATRPDAVVIVDYPGFNLTLARWMQKRSIPVVYYIPPQIWAWGGWRLRKIAKRIDTAVVVFPFEESIYRPRGVPTCYVGHPLFDYLRQARTRDDFRPFLGVPEGRKLVSLLPGSRAHEIDVHLPMMLDVADILAAEHKDISFAVSVATDGQYERVQRIVASHTVPAALVREDTFDLMRHSDLCLVTSGTATLETAHFGTPMVVLYKVPWWHKIIGRLFMRTRRIALVNILAGKEIVPEFFLGRNDVASVADAALEILQSRSRRDAILRDIETLRERIDVPGASDRCARIVLRTAMTAAAASPEIRSVVRKRRGRPAPELVVPDVAACNALLAKGIED